MSAGEKSNRRPDALALNAMDDVAVLIREVEAGEAITIACDGRMQALAARARIPVGHKIALRPMPSGHLVRKYGEVIGRLLAPVETGEHVHVHNLVSLRA